MIKKIELAYIRKIARMYIKINDMPRRQAVFEAYKAYEYFKEAEMEIMYEEYERTR